jgi:hypothetical protein
MDPGWGWVNSASALLGQFTTGGHIRCLSQKTVADSSGAFAINTLAIPSTTVLASLQSLLGTENHVLYIEVGPVQDPTISFGPVS